MAVSGSVDFYTSVTEATIIEDALDEINALAVGQSIPGTKYTKARRRLNQLIKRLQNRPVPVYIHKKATTNFSTVASTAAYVISSSIAADVRRINHAWLLIDGTRVPLEFKDLTEMDKVLTPAAENQPQYWTYVPAGTQYPEGSIQLSPVPDKVYDVHVRYEGMLNDFDATTDNPDLPVGAVDMLIKGLAVAMAPSERVSLQERQLLEQEFASLLLNFLAGQNETDATSIKVPRGVDIV